MAGSVVIVVGLGGETVVLVAALELWTVTGLEIGTAVIVVGFAVTLVGFVVAAVTFVEELA